VRDDRLGKVRFQKSARHQSSHFDIRRVGIRPAKFVARKPSNDIGQAKREAKAIVH